MANKRIRKRKKRQLKKAFKQVVKVVKVVKVEQPKVSNYSPGFSPDYLPPYQEPPVVDPNEKYEERNKKYQSKLDFIYGGTVQVLTNYINDKATLVFHCEECGLTFFGKPSHMVGKESQQHLCGFPLSDRHGNRLGSVSSAHKPKKPKKGTTIKPHEFNEMIWNDLSYQEIARELQCNPLIVKDHFKQEGLIE